MSMIRIAVDIMKYEKHSLLVLRVLGVRQSTCPARTESEGGTEMELITSKLGN